MNTKTKISIFTCLLLLTTNQAFAWGDRGHEVVTRVAIRLLAENTEQAGSAFASREHMLAHLSNVPDIHWRAPYMSTESRSANAPTHYIDMDLLYPAKAMLKERVMLKDIGREYDALEQLAQDKNLDLATQVGTAPWRVLQLQREVVLALTDAGNASTQEDMVNAVNQALLYAGLMSHFVADLANPHHNTVDHNGLQTGQGGLHAYFETMVVNSLDLNLAYKVMEYSRNNNLASRLLSEAGKEQQTTILSDPSKLIFSLILDSLYNLDYLRELDREYSLLKPSTEQNRRAERKPPTQIAGNFEPFIVERLSLGALILQQLWFLAWEEAGSPNLQKYQSYHYWLTPDFIDPDYLD